MSPKQREKTVAAANLAAFLAATVATMAYIMATTL